MENSFHSHLDSNIGIATKFCTWHDSCAVVACANISCDLMASNGVMARRSFHRIWIAGKKPLVKQAPVQEQAMMSGNAGLFLTHWSPGDVAVILQVNTLRPRQNGRHFADGTFKHIFLIENVRISIKISLKFVPKSPIDNIPALFRIMAWRRPGNMSLSEPMMASLLMHICVTRPQWVKLPN